MNIKDPVPGDKSFPTRLLTATVLSVFTAEVIVMFILAMLPEMAVTTEAFVDGALLSLLVFPLLYLLEFRPLLFQIAQREQAENALQRVNEDLEQRVKERTAELQQANEHLQSEILERQRAEAESKKNRDFILRIIESVPDLTFIYDLEKQRCIYINGRVKEWLGYDPEDIYLMGDGFTNSVAGLKGKSDPFADIQARFTTSQDSDVICIEADLIHANGDAKGFQIRSVVYGRSESGMPRSILCNATENIC